MKFIRENFIGSIVVVIIIFALVLSYAINNYKDNHEINENKYIELNKLNKLNNDESKCIDKYKQKDIISYFQYKSITACAKEARIKNLKIKIGLEHI